MSSLLTMDVGLLQLINRGLANPVFDVFFPFWTDIQKHPVTIYGLLPLFLLIVIIKKKWRLFKIVLFASLGTAAADKINHYFVKAYFIRPRPVGTILRIKATSSPSFPSGHAVDAFFLAMVLGLFFPKRRVLFFFLATLTALSRTYCGVHYPSDILAGASLGSGLGFIFYKVMTMKKMDFLRLTIVLFFFCLPSGHAAFEDPTKGKPFFPWIWNDQLRPTIKKSVDRTGLMIAGAGAAASFTTGHYDKKIQYYNRDHRILFDEKGAKQLGKLGNGVFGVTLAVTQLVYDQENGLRHARALLLTTTSHIGIAALVQRDRPGNKTDFLPYPSSFPSGHTSAAFATAGSLAYSYGRIVGIPAYIVASAISISRLREERHWASDIVAGAFLGTFWARASFNVDKTEPESVMVLPSPVYDGIMVTAVKEF